MDAIDGAVVGRDSIGREVIGGAAVAAAVSGPVVEPAAQHAAAARREMLTLLVAAEAPANDAGRIVGGAIDDRVMCGSIDRPVGG